MNSIKPFQLNNFFTHRTFNKLIENYEGETTYDLLINKYIDKVDGKNNEQLIKGIYQELKDNYRNEYFYKNTLLNKLLLGVHSTNTTTALAEVPIARSKADFILINGKAVIYEIKTELDNFDRLASQLDDYYKAFNYVTVLTSEDNYQAIEKKLTDTTVGIAVLTKKNQISRISGRKPVEHNENLDLNTIFKILRKSEFETIIKNYYGSLPNVSQFNYYNACCQMFCEIDTKTAYNLFIKELKNRKRINGELLDKVPYELKSLIYFSKLSTKDYHKLYSFLNKQYRG